MFSTHYINDDAYSSACGGSSKSNDTQASQQPDYQQMQDNAVEGAILVVILSIDSPEVTFLGSTGVSDLETF